MARDLLRRERVAVGLGVVGHVGRRPADVGAQLEEAGPVLDRHGPAHRRFEGVGVVGDLAQVLGVPAVGLEALDGVVVEGDLGRPVDGDVVVVVDVDEAARARGGPARDAASWLMPSIRSPSLQMTKVWWSTRSGPYSRPQHALGDAEADAVGEALAERAGGDLDALQVARLGVARGPRAELAELLRSSRVEAVARSGTASSTAGCRRGRRKGRSGRGRASRGRRRRSA